MTESEFSKRSFYEMPFYKTAISKANRTIIFTKNSSDKESEYRASHDSLCFDGTLQGGLFHVVVIVLVLWIGDQSFGPCVYDELSFPPFLFLELGVGVVEEGEPVLGVVRPH